MFFEKSRIFYSGNSTFSKALMFLLIRERKCTALVIMVTSMSIIYPKLLCKVFVDFVSEILFDYW